MRHPRGSAIYAEVEVKGVFVRTYNEGTGFQVRGATGRGPAPGWNLVILRSCRKRRARANAARGGAGAVPASGTGRLEGSPDVILRAAGSIRLGSHGAPFMFVEARDGWWPAGGRAGAGAGEQERRWQGTPGGGLGIQVGRRGDWGWSEVGGIRADSQVSGLSNWMTEWISHRMLRWGNPEVGLKVLRFFLL